MLVASDPVEFRRIFVPPHCGGMEIKMKFLKELVYTLLWILHDKSAAYKPRSNLPQHEIEAIVHAFYPAVVAFFESEEGKREFEEWKAKKEAEEAGKKTVKKSA